MTRRLTRHGMLGCALLALAGAPPALSSPVTGPDATVVVGRDTRSSALPPGEVGKSAFAGSWGATGTIECGGMRSTGQLTGRGDLVTTAAHALYDENGQSRAASGACRFIIAVGGTTRSIALKPDPARCGSTRPYGMAGHHDWAVGRLAEPVTGIRPYRLGLPPSPGQGIVVVSYSPERGRTVDHCQVREVVEKSDGGPREIRTDCTGRGGLSGAAYLTTGPDPAIVGIHVGYRSATPGSAAPYSSSHYTFGTTAERRFKAAVAD
ncbi:trypsin-like peptidase domain-containing protein [Prosthecomicrobium hirschii]|uniref:trypsin-like peptidase domain-containing protein n=1 Tax=Prosthecodimorpha hirschii TaxID=665126 RepID=UPI0009F9054F|nr:trypsin-like peptidase domain-containing protein [Prosthecomicrobium hirschii]MCW1843233.1 trypsin-like peptidase domain-containing protein [Prosthecomicrobium hirschii]TPQ51223.1 hypothetical protein C2U72_09445 [Prosthecomicrobium hirschii]